MLELAKVSKDIWDMKYRLKALDGTPLDASVDDTWRRVAQAAAAAEKPEKRAAVAQAFEEILQGFRFIPAGRVIAGAGSGRKVTLFNCFVMGEVEDDMRGIFDALKESALTMQQGGGIGLDFSTLRPQGAPVQGVGADASGPLSFMDVWDAMCRTIMSAGSRRGAMMATLRCDHPDIEAFIEAKRDAQRLRMFNLSVLVTDAFMTAVSDDKDWDLVFAGKTFKTLKARALWDQIMRATYDVAEPGVVFIDRINARNNLHYCETIHSVNPCGEQNLPPYGACLLGSINLASLVKHPFTEQAGIDVAELEKLTATAIRLLDNIIDVSGYPLAAQAQEAKAKRRIGLGVTGLADALIMCKQRYGTPRSLEFTESWLRHIRRAAYLASIELAKEKGAFPLFDRDQYLAGATIQELDEDIRSAIAAHGIRNALLTSIAPTGTISLFAGNVSSGIEPVFAYTARRKLLLPDGTRREEVVEDYAHRLYRDLHGLGPLPDYFVNAQTLEPKDHVAMQAAAQRYIDSSISKTVNVPESISFEAFKDIYLEAYRLGCKGCTTYRPNAVTGSVLSVSPQTLPAHVQTTELKSFPPPLAGEVAAKQPEGGRAKPHEISDVVYMTKPLDRPVTLDGQTYKVKWPDSDHALYITLNDIEQDGRQRPFEIFINSKNMEHYAWTVALTRMISAVFRRGGDVAFVVEELKAVFDPRGGQWMNGRYVPSLLAAIGDVIETHMIEIGFIQKPDRPQFGEDVRKALAASESSARPEPPTITATRSDLSAEASAKADPRLRPCPRCGAAALARIEGCDTCFECGYSRCG